MKRNSLKVLLAFLVCTFLLSSCYTYTSVVGKGAQGNQEVTKWNHYLIYGLAPVSTSDSKAMAGDATDYTITTTHNFVCGLINGLTWGIYTPTITTVKK